MAFWTYILHCSDGSYYTGHTEHLENRIADHQHGRFRGYTRNRRPVRLAWSQDFQTRYEALQAERKIKGWSKAKKEALIDGRWDEVSRLARKRSNFVLRQAQDERKWEIPDSSESVRGEPVGPRISVAPEALTQIQAHARTAFPRECCGILLGTPIHITAAIPAPNVHPTPHTRFEIDPQTLIDAHRAARSGGPNIAGYYHSHPHGPAHPSATDRDEAAHDGAIWAIVGEAGDVTFWRDDEDRFTPLSYALASR